MPRHPRLDDDGDDDFDADEDYDSDEYDAEDGDLEDDDAEEPTIACPYCGQEIHEDSQRCPHCEHYVSEEDAPLTKKPWWIVVGVIACLYLVYRWTIG